MTSNNQITDKHAGKNGTAGTYTQSGFSASAAQQPKDKRPICWHCGERKGFLHVCKK